ncbi:MAG: GTP-binding protein Obg [Phormidesmis priestleyi Ana]|uniref:GTPase Obg n=1 Tax=Phormidesmis priestleyi Ana TaxID=1666911 RepID=A0A0P7ZRC4_9CYAN|nr:MAG: GTP-binding protein Obg [Phormidesmis priestleyi Ana]
MQFIDHAEAYVEGGTGGDGMTSFRREKYVPAGGPSGGTGGNGGSVVLVANSNLQTLLDFRYAHRFKAPDGEKGGSKNKTGAAGEDLLVEVPCGTLVYDIDKDTLLGDLTEPGQRLVVAPGGKGGLGNKHFLSNRNRAPERSQPGAPGAIRQIKLELKLLAEVGIIGLPNAGKSTLISTLSSAQPKIADYPFTTLIPNLGVVRKPTGDGTLFADIPGLIAGAHEGQGLGHDFLRHIERTKLLLHLVDGTAEDPVSDYSTIQQELIAYGQGLVDKPQLLAINKIDALLDEEVDELTSRLAAVTGTKVFRISAVSRQGEDELLRAVWQLLDETNEAIAAEEARAAQALIDFNTPILPLRPVL